MFDSCTDVHTLKTTAISLLLYLMAEQMFLPCNHSNEPSTVFDGCTDVLTL